MKKAEAFYMPRRNVNVRMKHNVSVLRNPRFTDERKKINEDMCEHRKTNGIENAPSLAMVFSPIQEWREIYDLSTALERGTLFKELDKPLEVCEKNMGGGHYGF